jgi:hypothetical protein
VLLTVTLPGFDGQLSSRRPLENVPISWSLEVTYAVIVPAGELVACRSGNAGPRGLPRLTSTPLLPQRIYRLEHAELDTLELYLVPIAQDASGTRYEPVFG